VIAKFYLAFGGMSSPISALSNTTNQSISYVDGMTKKTLDKKIEIHVLHLSDYTQMGTNMGFFMFCAFCW